MNPRPMQKTIPEPAQQAMDGLLRQAADMARAQAIAARVPTEQLELEVTSLLAQGLIEICAKPEDGIYGMATQLGYQLAVRSPAGSQAAWVSFTSECMIRGVQCGRLDPYRVSRKAEGNG